jgi:hypothetical protein
MLLLSTDVVPQNSEPVAFAATGSVETLNIGFLSAVQAALPKPKAK